MKFPIVQVTEGKVQGVSRKDAEDQTYYAFFSVPYAKPPIGNLRFKAPQAAETWEGIRDATQQRTFCTQPFGGMQASEDCLTIHIYTKKLPSEEPKLKPVMVWIHGGGFLSGSNKIRKFGPDFLVTKDVVVACINYRVGLFGFLSLQDASLDVPGNAGLKDQVQALKWVQKNIKNFNGDPDNVTIFGESAGGTSVDYLVLSSTAKNLFHRAIIMSGSAFCPWARGFFDPADFAKYLGRPNLGDRDILKLLTDMPASNLSNAQTEYQKKKFFCDFGMIGPVIEKPNPSAFITEHPIDIIKAEKHNDVPVIIGYCVNEGLLIKILNIFTGRLRTDDEMMKYYLPFDTNFKESDQVTKLSKKMKDFYGKEEYKKNPYLLPTDGLFVSAILTSAINLSKSSKNPVYLYRFSFDGKLNLIKKIAGLTEPGATHGDILNYLWKCGQGSSIENPEKQVLQRIVEMLTNFAKNGNPTPTGSSLNVEWNPISGGNINFLDIGKELVIGVNPESDRLNFWKEIFQMNPVTAKFL